MKRKEYIYGLVGFISSVRSPEPFEAFYWAAAYLAAVATAVSFHTLSFRERGVRSLILMSWFCLFVMSTGEIIVCRDLIFSGASSSYDTYSYAGSSVYGMPMVLSSGMGRSAGVIGLVIACTVLRNKTWRRFLWIVPLLLFTFVVFRMQSRGAMIAYTVSFLFVLFMFRSRWLFLVLTIIIIFLVLPSYASRFYEKTSVYLTRGADNENLLTLSGRTQIWSLSHDALSDAWFVGWGHQGDRKVVGRHIHNAFLYAAISAGFSGCIVYIMSWIKSWVILWRLLQRISWAMIPFRGWIMESTVILLFFSIRSVLEITTASFTIDLLTVLPIITYLEVLQYQSIQPNVETDNCFTLRIVHHYQNDCISQTLQDAEYPYRRFI